jgi:hypothetical protein
MIKNRTFLMFGLFLVFISSFIRLQSCFADVVWMEDFDDGDLDGWTIVLGECARASSSLSVNILDEYARRFMTL